jgi:hypothetical protein
VTGHGPRFHQYRGAGCQGKDLTAGLGEEFSLDIPIHRAFFRSPNHSHGGSSSPRWNFRYGQVYKFQCNDLTIALNGKLDGSALKGAADCGGMLQSDWNNKRRN